MTELESLRKTRNMTVRQLAEATGLSLNTILRMEQSQSERKGGISIESACLVADFLGLKVSEVFPDTTLNYTQGRPPKTGVQMNQKPQRNAVKCSAPGCGSVVSNHEIADGKSECHEASLVS